MAREGGHSCPPLLGHPFRRHPDAAGQECPSFLWLSPCRKVDTPVHLFSVIHFDFTLTPRDKSVSTPQGRRLFVFERNISLPEGCLDDFVRFFLYFGSSEDVGAHPAPQPHSKYPCRYGNRSKKGRALYKTGRENHGLDACLHTASKNQYWNK